MTGMYNVLEKLRREEELTAKSLGSQVFGVRYRLKSQAKALGSSLV